jgi:hypothetical protein
MNYLHANTLLHGACRGRHLVKVSLPFALRVATGHSSLFQNGAQTKLAFRLRCPIANYGLDPRTLCSPAYPSIWPTFIPRSEPKDHF